MRKENMAQEQTSVKGTSGNNELNPRLNDS